MVKLLKHSVHQNDQEPAPTGRTRGRPPATSARRIATTALDLFAAQGFEATTMDDVARAVGIARRTLFTYYRSKNAIVWDGQEQASEAVSAALEAVPATVPWREALVRTLPEALRYPDDDLGLLRHRLRLIGATPALHAHLVAEQDSAIGAVARFIATREDCGPDDLVPSVMARAVLASVSASLVWWATSAEPDPRVVLTGALHAVLQTR